MEGDILTANMVIINTVYWTKYNWLFYVTTDNSLKTPRTEILKAKHYGLV